MEATVYKFGKIDTCLTGAGIALPSRIPNVSIDLWKKQNFDFLIKHFSESFQLIYKSRPLNYLPQNSSFSNKIKIRIVILQKI